MQKIRMQKRPLYSEILEILVDPEDIWNAPSPERLKIHDEVGPADSPLGLLRVYLKAYSGRDSATFSNKMMASDRKGRSKMYAGDVQKEKVCRGVYKLEGLYEEEGDRERSSMTPEQYDETPSWILNRILDRLNERAGEDEEDEGK